MAERALVTGGTGFLGQHLVRRLLGEGLEVVILARPSRQSTRRPIQDLADLGARMVQGDMLDAHSLRLALRGVTSVFHLAGRLLKPGIPSEAYDRLHVDGTRKLLEACADTGNVRTIVHCSTTGVLGPTGQVPGTEDMPAHPDTIYERSKAAGEQLALAIAQKCGLPLVVARPALVYGPGDLHLLGWFRAIQRGFYRVVGRGDNLLHPIYVDDIADGLLRCATTPAAIGRVYQLVGERPIAIRDFAAAIGAALGRPLARQHLPTSLALGIAALIEALPGLPPERLPLTRSRIAFMTESRAYSGTRARHELGFVPRVDLETGLQYTVAWYRSEGLL